MFVAANVENYTEERAVLLNHPQTWFFFVSPTAGHLKSVPFPPVPLVAAGHPFIGVPERRQEFSIWSYFCLTSLLSLPG